MVWVPSSRVQDTPLQQYLLSSLCLFDSIFQAYFGLISYAKFCLRNLFQCLTRKEKDSFSLFMVMIAKSGSSITRKKWQPSYKKCMYSIFLTYRAYLEPQK